MASFPSIGLGLTPGNRFGSCTIIRAGSSDSPDRGAIAISLEDRQGQSFTVDLLRHDPETPGVAQAGSLEVFLSNDGDGVRVTNEEHGLAAIAIAKHLARLEASGVTLPRLLTLRERAALRKNSRRRT
jgi:hypothetical protein